MYLAQEYDPRDEAEWREWLAGPELFGQLVVNNSDPAGPPWVTPLHATLRQDELVLHLAVVNPCLADLEVASRVRFVVTGDSAYVHNQWRARPDVPPEHGVPTSYYTSVQVVGTPQVVDDPAEIAEILELQFEDLQPDGGWAELSATDGPYAAMLPAIRGLRIPLERVEATFKYDDEKPVAHRERVVEELRRRGRPGDAEAADAARRRLDESAEYR